MPGIGIISNPYAKVNKRNPEHNTLMWYILGNKGQYEITRSVNDLSSVCLEFQARGIDLVGVVGGDGTISLTLSALYQAYGPSNLPKIMILRGGTVNVLAGNLGIYGKPKDIMNDFVECYHSGKPLHEMTIHTMIANGRLGFLFANGAASKFLAEFYKNKTNSIGAGLFLSKVAVDGLLGGALGGAFKKISDAEPMRIQTQPNTLWQDGNEKSKYSMVFASTIPKMPFGLTLYRKLKTEEPYAEMLAVATEGKALISQVMKAIGGKTLANEHIANILMKRAEITAEPGATFSLDGDLMTTHDGKIVLEVGPAFTFCSPYGKIL